MDLTNQFLIAMPGLADPNFYRTVTYMCAHGKEGAMGIVINRPLDLTLGEVLSQMGIDASQSPAGSQQVLQGGPVQSERGFVLHSPVGEWDSVLDVGNGVGVATSKDILSAIAEGAGPQHAVVALGYAGWNAGQLEREVLDNVWLSVSADKAILFDAPYEKRWQQAATLLGVDVDKLSGVAGHS